jgi:hypothetical protein
VLPWSRVEKVVAKCGPTRVGYWSSLVLHLPEDLQIQVPLNTESPASLRREYKWMLAAIMKSQPSINVTADMDPGVCLNCYTQRPYETLQKVGWSVACFAVPRPERGEPSGGQESSGLTPLGMREVIC